MKHIIAYSLGLLMLALCSCKNAGDVTFYESFNESFSVPALTLAGATDTFSTPSIPNDLDSLMKANNTSANLVQSVKLQAMTLTITAPAGQNFSYLKSVQVFILTDSLPAVEIANQYTISGTSDTLNMNADNAQLKPYLLSSNFQIKFLVTNNQATTAAQTVNAYLRFQFVANILAAL
jgi:hypothetical protein